MNKTNEVKSAPVTPLDELKLIDGTFTPDQAQEVLLSLIDSKIQFHQLNNFSSEIKYGKKDQHSIDRVQELKTLKKQIIDIIALAESENKKLNVSSMLNISFID